MAAVDSASEKTPVVLVHGMGSSYERDWGRHGWVGMLEDEGLEALGFELPGHGASARLRDSNDSGVARLVEFCQAHGEVDIVGFSAGAVLSLTAVARRPELFRRVALLGLADTQLNVSVDDMRAAATDRESRVMRAVQAAAQRAGNDVTAVLDWVSRADAPPAFADLSRVASPVLLLLGEQDFLGEPDRILESLPRARLVKLPDTDHFTTTSRPEAKLLVLDFLTS